MSDVKQHKANANSAMTLSEAAMQHLLAYLGKEPNSKGIRLALKKTGCSGFSYVVDQVLVPQEHDIVQLLTENYALYIDKASYPYLKGVHIDYVKRGLNYKLEFSNPNQSGQCGCGESFTVEAREEDSAS